MVLDRPFPTYPAGFPAALLAEFARGPVAAVLGNRAASGTAILDELGTSTSKPGHWIIYTSADSVFQVAAHEAVVPLGGTLCGMRHRPRDAESGPGRLASDRPAVCRFTGTLGADRAPQGFLGRTARRTTLLDRLAEARHPGVRSGEGR